MPLFAKIARSTMTSLFCFRPLECRNAPFHRHPVVLRPLRDCQMLPGLFAREALLEPRERIVLLGDCEGALPHLRHPFVLSNGGGEAWAGCQRVRADG
jgi:hypothetical protein